MTQVEIEIPISDDVRELLNAWPLGWSFGLPVHSTVIVAGAYKGRVIDLLDQLYHPARIFGFDPQPWAIQEAQARVGSRPNVYLLQFGLGVEDGVFPMGEWETDACSFVNTGPGSRQRGVGVMREVGKVMQDLVPLIDLFVMNMEGYEFTLLPHMMRVGMTNNIDRLVIQFHHGFGNDHTYPAIREQLALTHDIIQDSAPSWVYWRRKE